jgi:hypothetical protein
LAVKETGLIMVQRLILAIAFLIISTAAFAHGSGQHVLGTVTAIDAKHLEVKTPKGKTVTVQLNGQTRFKEKGNPKKAEPPTVGDRVVIEATKEDKIMTATEVHYAAAKHAPVATQ